MKKLLAAVIVVGAIAFMLPGQIDQRSEVVAEVNCATPPEQCKDKKEDVGVVDWMFGNHRVPSLHFIDFVELFLR